MKIVSARRFGLWTRELLRWLSRKFDSISIDLTPVEEKLDEVKSDVADVKEAVENIDIDTSDLAKQGTNPNATNTAILAAFGNIDFSTLAKQGTNADATLTAVLEALQGGDDPDIPEGVAERLAMILEFFGLPEALPEIEVATEQEVKDINDDVMGALYGYGKVAVTIHSLMRTGAETTQDLASVIYVDPEKTWSANGYPTLYDDEGNAIDTTTNPAQGDEVFNYQIQES